MLSLSCREFYGVCKFCFISSIDLIHKWGPRNYSFVFLQIILTSLDSKNKIQKNFCSKVRLVRTIRTKINE